VVSLCNNFVRALFFKATEVAKALIITDIAAKELVKSIFSL
jgi:hypothetical protein